MDRSVYVFKVFPPSMFWQPPSSSAVTHTEATKGSGPGKGNAKGRDEGKVKQKGNLKESDPEYVPKVRDLFTAANLKKFDKPWSEKRDVAFFRGTATGGE